MENKIVIPVKFRDLLEGLHYEKNSRINLLNFMIMHDMKKDPMFEKVHEEYTEFYIQFEEAKKKLEEMYLKPNSINIKGWKLDFKSMEVSVNE